MGIYLTLAVFAQYLLLKIVVLDIYWLKIYKIMFIFYKRCKSKLQAASTRKNDKLICRMVNSLSFYLCSLKFEIILSVLFFCIVSSPKRFNKIKIFFIDNMIFLWRILFNTDFRDFF